jgi:hypothetical protein
MTNNQKPASGAAHPSEDLSKAHLLDSPKGPTPAPNPESAPGGDKVGGEMRTAPFTGALLHPDKPAPHK